MGCNCGQRTLARQTTRQVQNVQQSGAGNVDAAVSAGSKTWYEVWRNGTYVGRRSDSLMVAQDIARRMGGEVRAVG